MVDALDLARRVRSGSFPPTLYLEGPSEAVKTELLASLRRAWAAATPDAPPRVLRAAESSVEEILALFQGASLFNPRDLILVLEIEDLGRSDKRVGALADGLAVPAGGSCLALIESAAENARKSLEPLRAACAARVVALPPDAHALLGWGALKLEEHGLSAEPGVLEQLAEAADGEALAFFGELSILAAWADRDRPVRVDDVAQILRPALGAELPDYVAAVANGDSRLAGQRLGRLLAAGVGEGTILFALSNVVGGALGGWKRYHAASDTLRRRRGSGDLVRALDAVYRAEAAWKGGRADVVALLEQATRDVSGAS
jgi:DNA polymerase III delta subunit